MCCFDLCIRGACCCCQAMCNDVCKSFKKMFTLSIRQQMRLAYISLFFLFTFFIILSMYEIPSWLGMWSRFIHCPVESSNPKDNLACLGVSALYRMSSSLVILFAFLLLMCLPRNEASKFINENFWFQKVFGLIALFIMQMWIPNDTYSWYGSIAFFFGIIFALFQIVMCIDLFYCWSENWVKSYEQGGANYEYLLYGFSLSLYALTGYLIYQNYQLFPCQNTQNLINILMVAAITIINLSPINNKPSVLVSGAVSLLITYFNWSSMTNIQDVTCNAYAQQQDAYIKIEGFIGVFLIILSLGYITFGSSDESVRSSFQNDNLMASMRRSEQEEQNSEDEDDFIIDDLTGEDLEQDGHEMKKIEKKNSIKKENEETTAQLVRKELRRIRELRQIKRMKDYQTNTYILFHLIMILSSFYIVMLLTNYGAIQIDEKINWNNYKTSSTSLNIKLGLSYFTALIYIWTIIAPSVFPDREF